MGTFFNFFLTKILAARYGSLLLFLSLGFTVSDNTEPVLSVAFMDKSVNPGDDFYLYATGNWIKNNPVPEQYSRFSSFEKLQDINQRQIRELLENAANNRDGSNPVRKILGTFYSTGMDTSVIESGGFSALKNEFIKIETVRTIPDVQKQIAYFHTIGVNTLFYIYPGQDMKNTSQVITQLSQGGICLPDRDYYTGEDPRPKEIRQAYLDHIIEIFTLADEEKKIADMYARKVIEIETRLANASLTAIEQRAPERVYNKTDMKGLEALCPGFDWNTYFSHIGVLPKEINIRQVDFFREVSKMMNEIPVNDWKIYLKWNLLNESADYLGKKMAASHFKFYGTILTGTLKQPDRWKKVLAVSNTILGEAVGQLYVEKYFPPDAKKKMLRLVSDLKEALASHINILPWMSDETKQYAIEKLNAVTLKIGYPDKWKDYTGLELNAASYVTNVFLVKKFNFRRELSRVDKPADRLRWGMPPQTINAYYSIPSNEIIFPAGILQPPFFDMYADDAANYGAIGSVIGHELTHGFDDQGCRFDKSGNLNNWWKKEDAEKFENLAGLVVDHFEKFTLLDSLHVNGRLTLSENIADLGGLAVSLTALKKVMKNQPQGSIDGFTPLQRFFISYAQLWKLSIRDKELIRRIKEDFHATSEARVNGIVYNFPEFYDAFGITSGKRFISSENRIKIW